MTVALSPLSVAMVDGRIRRNDWLRVPYVVFADDPAWIPPLLFQEKRRIAQRHNPFFTFGEAAFFIAYRGDHPIGRVSAQINRRFQQRHGGATGHFGFFDCSNDSEAAVMLIEAASNWLRARHADRMEGPYALSINEECGLLVEGFDTPACMLMNHSRPYMHGLLEEAGLAKVMDTFAYRLSPRKMPKQAERFVDYARNHRSVTIRQIDTSNFDEEVRIVIDIFNDAWSENWGFVPFSEAEIVALIKELKPFYRTNYGRIALIDERPVGMILAIPDINGLVQGFGGRLLPFNWVRLALGLWKETFHTARIPLMGIRRSYQKSLAASEILALMAADFINECKGYDLEWVEFSWVLEVNKAMNALGQMVAGAPAKRYRLYAKSLY